MSAQSFIIKESFLKIANTLLYEKLTEEDSSALKLIFEEMMLEAVEHYISIIKLLPLENIHPNAILPFLPPGRSQEQLVKPYWQKVRALIGDIAFKTVFIEDKHNVFE